MMPVVLWTDALVFLLLAAAVGAGFQVRRRAYLLASWRRVGESRAGMAALLVLLAFAAIGLLDSLHYRPRLADANGRPANGYSTEVRSALDALLRPLRNAAEKTYSAPLATHLYARETVEQPDGTQVRLFPRLKHGGAHLRDALIATLGPLPSAKAVDRADQEYPHLLFLAFAVRALFVVYAIVVGEARHARQTIPPRIGVRVKVANQAHPWPKLPDGVRRCVLVLLGADHPGPAAFGVGVDGDMLHGVGGHALARNDMPKQETIGLVTSNGPAFDLARHHVCRNRC